MVRLFACITILSAVLVSLFSLTSLKERETFVLVGRVEGNAPEGRVPLAFHFYDVKTRDLVYRVVADVEVRNGTYSAVLPVGSLRKGGEFYVCATAPEVVLESFQEQGGGVLGIVLLQSSTPGIQQTGHINISGTLISGSVRTSAFQMSTGAGAGRVLTSDASGVGTWQALPPPSGSAGGDLSGTYPNPTVARLQTRPVSSTAPTSGQVLKWTGTMWAPSTDNDTTYSAGAGLQLSGNTFSVATGGVVTSMLADLAVTTVKIADSAVTDAKLSTTGVTAGTYGSATQVGVFTVNAQGRITSASNVTISGVSPGGSAGGDLSGTYPNPTVAGLQTRPVSSTAPTSGQVLKWTGTMWAPSADNDTTYSAGAGLQLSGNTFSVATGGVVTSMLADLAVTTVKIADSAVTDAKLSTTGVTAGTYGSATQVGVFTVNAQGRITSASNVTISGVSPGGSAGGDLSGTYPNPTVAGLQTRPVSSTAPSSGQVLKWTGTMWAPAADDVGGLTLPFSGSANVAGAAFSITNTATSGNAYGGWFQSDSTSGLGVLGLATATSGNAHGVYGQSASTSGRGVFGWATATTGGAYGVYGQSASTSGRGVSGLASATSGTTYGVYGRSESPDGRGVFGYAAATGGTNYGVYGQSDSGQGYGGYFRGIGPDAVYITNSGLGRGLQVVASADTAVWALTSTGFAGVDARNNSTSGRGVLGWATATTGGAYGVYGQSDSTSGRGVFGWATATTGGAFGVYGQSASTSGRGVFGWATATSGTTYGVYGLSASPDGLGVFGYAAATSGPAWGVWGRTDSSASTAYAVIGVEPSGGAGHAVYAQGTLAATGTKSFQIDHPLNPENYYLNHFCTEGPEPYNVYRGNVVTDEKGYATIQLPDYFESINRDPTYHLTVIDDSDDFILAKVVREIQNNQFVIRTSKPHVKVSWEVKAIRNDRWVQKYGYKTEQEKEDSIKGKYVQPELYGMPKEYGIHYRPDVERPALERATPPAHLEPPRTPRLEERKAPPNPPTPSARGSSSRIPRPRTR